MSLDIFEKFLKMDAESSTEVRKEVNVRGPVIDHKGQLQPPNASEGDAGYEDWTGLGGRRGYQKGTIIHHMRVLGPHIKQGREARYTNRKYRVECIAPTGVNGAPCGKKGLATYHQLYYGTLYSCGCLIRPKHPPIKLESQRIGRVEVLRWTEEHEGAWELLCHECGELLYRKTVAQVRAAGASCDSHKRLAS